MADSRGGGGASRRRRTAGRSASTGAADRRSAAASSSSARRRGLPAGFSEGRPLPEEQRSTLRMEPRERVAGVVAAVLLVVIGVLFITVHPAHGQVQPDTTGPIIGIVLAVVVVASLAIGNRIVSGVLAVLSAFLLQTPHVAHSIEYLRKGALVIAVAFALWLTLQQRHTQIDNRLRRMVDHRSTVDGVDDRGDGSGDPS